MYLLKTEATFDSAHFLAGYDGKCSNIHGHTWKISAEIFGEEICQEGQQRGMITDFGVLKSELRAIADSFDHTLIYESGTLRHETISALCAENFSLKQVDFRPTAENFAKHFFELMKEKGFAVKRVSVYETAVNCAVYEE